MSIIVAPSMLSANFGNLDKDVEMVNQSEAGWFHLDIMDGVWEGHIFQGGLLDRNMMASFPLFQI